MPICWHSSATLRLSIQYSQALYEFAFFNVCRIYNKLPEVTRKKEEEKKRVVSQTNRLRAEVFKKVKKYIIFGTENEFKTLIAVHENGHLCMTKVIQQNIKSKQNKIPLITLCSNTAHAVNHCNRVAFSNLNAFCKTKCSSEYYWRCRCWSWWPSHIYLSPRRRTDGLNFLFKFFFLAFHC